MATTERVMMISTHGYVAADPELGKPDTGGQVVYVLEVSRCLARMGYKVDILTRRFEDQPREERVAPRVRILRFSCGGNDFIPKETLVEHMPEWVSNALRYVKGKRVKYNFINSHYWDAGVAGETLAGKLQIPHMHTPHSIGAWKRENMDGNSEKLDKLYNFPERIRREKIIYDECDALIATTPHQREILQSASYGVPKEKIYVVPPGYDDTRFYPVSEEHRMTLKKEYGYESKIVLALGRVARNKGFDLLTQAMPAVFQRVQDAKLLLPILSESIPAKEQELIDEIKQIAAEHNISDRIILKPHVSEDELPDYYRIADVFALSSRYEPFGMTAVEAMACGTPTIVTTEGGLWEHVTWGLDALYANPFDPETFGHAIAMILQYPRVTSQLSKYGSQKARAQFTWMGIAQRILNIMYGFRMGTAIHARQQYR